MLLFHHKTSFCSEFFLSKLLFALSGHVGKQHNYKDKVNFKSHDVTSLEVNNYNTHIATSRNKFNHTMKFGQFIEYKMKNIFPEKS